MTTDTQPHLFPLPEDSPPTPVAHPAANPAPPRLRKPERFQVQMHCESLDQRLAAEHLARDIWDFVNGLDTTPLLQNIQAVEGRCGRDHTDPKVLLSIWLLAFAEGHGSARGLARLCERDRAYEWLRGGVTLNYHLLADFRVAHWDYLNHVFTDSLTAFLHEGLLEPNRTAQDGMRIAASAGKASFRRAPTLEHCRVEASERVEKLNREFQEGSAPPAQERAVRERLQRLGPGRGIGPAARSTHPRFGKRSARFHHRSRRPQQEDRGWRFPARL